MCQETTGAGTSCNISRWIYDVFTRALQLKRTLLGAPLQALSFGNICCPSERETAPIWKLPALLHGCQFSPDWMIIASQMPKTERLPTTTSFSKTQWSSKIRKTGKERKHRYSVPLRELYNLNMYVSLIFRKIPNQKRKISYLLLHLFHV